MKSLVDSFLNFLEFITSDIFNYIGALARKPFIKKSYNQLVNETMSNHIGMLVLGIITFIIFAYIKISPA